MTDEIALVLTLDFFPPIVDDPFDYGAISAANALSDVYAVGGTPVTALNIAAFPRDLPSEIAAKVLEGGAVKAAEAHVSIVGGHTVEDREPKYGLAVTGIIRPGTQISNATARAGDVLILTKAIGTGVIATAGKAGVVDEEVLAGAVRSMTLLNRGAANAMREIGVHAATDVTGFGLLGHLHSAVKASGVAATLRSGAVPVLPGARELLEQGVAPGGTHRNMESLSEYLQWGGDVDEFERLLLCDAQTSGGMLISVAPQKAEALQEALMAEGCPFAAVIGEVEDGPPGRISITG